MADTNDLFEIISTTRAMRRLKPDPVPDHLIRKILEAGVSAASGGNRQHWRFMVIKDRAIKEKVQRYYQRALDEVVGPRYRNSTPPPGVTREQYDRQHNAVAYLTEHFHDAPVWIVACLDEGQGTPSRSSGASIYPAVQNMLLAARALGLGNRLVFAGFAKDVARVVSAFDISVFPSLWEGTPLTVFEALAMGKPIVATDADGLLDVLKHDRDALIVPRRDAPALAAGIVRLIEDPALRARLGAAARVTGQHYDIGAFVRKMEQLYVLLHRVSRATRRRGVLEADLSFLTSHAPA